MKINSDIFGLALGTGIGGLLFNNSNFTIFSLILFSILFLYGIITYKKEKDRDYEN